MAKKHKEKRSIASRILLIVGILLIVAALAIVGTLAWRYISARMTYSQLQDASGIESTDSGEITLDNLYVDWNSLWAINPDIVAWVIIPDTNINYPIIQGDDNEYYLHHLSDQTASANGAVFSDYQGSRELNALNNIIYGHDMLDGSMFAGLNKFRDQSYLDAHSTIFLATPEMNYQLSAIGCETVHGDDTKFRQFSFPTDAQASTISVPTFQSYVQYLLNQNVCFASGFSGKASDVKDIYSFVTCLDFDDSRRVVLSATIADTRTPSNVMQLPAQQ
ncbi:MAG: class B sortase [Coriobacteriales bacterium]|jgi:sortase B|nr:class B sortase [Coriobacteriales bacterium]